MPDREKVVKGLEEISDYFFDIYRKEKNGYSPAQEYCNVAEDALALLKEQEAMNVDTFMQWCIDSHIMGDATIRGIEYWVGKFKEGR